MTIARVFRIRTWSTVPARTKSRTKGIRAIGLCLLALCAVGAMVAAAPASATSTGALAWGDNSLGELGVGGTVIGPEECLGTTGCSRTPLAVSGLSEVKAVAAGNLYSVALLGDGTVRTWGSNRFGQLGRGTLEEPECPGLSGETCSTTPVEVKALPEKVTAISAGSDHILALLKGGRVFAWAEDTFGQLGNGTTEFSAVSAPVEVLGLTDKVTSISAGDGASYAILSSGKVMAWGLNATGQLGIGTTAGPEYCPEPVSCSKKAVKVEGLPEEEVTAIAGGNGHVLALLKSGKVMAWGDNAQGQLGNGTNEMSTKPVEVKLPEKATAISADGHHSLALLSKGKVMAWGDLSNTGLPVEVKGLPKEVTAISTGPFHSLVLLSKGTVMAWGENEQGQLGDGTVVSKAAPVEVKGLSGVAGISAEGIHSLAFQAPRLPTITKLSPTKGPAAGGTKVTITGTNFSGATSVKFGLVSATVVEVKSATSITATSPAEVAKAVDVTVTTPEGTTAISSVDQFKFGPPTVTKLSPNSGPMAGGTSVTVTGTGFGLGTEATLFEFGTTEATTVNCTSNTMCTVVAPSHVAGIVDVKATVSGQKSPKAVTDQFTYN